MRRELNLDVEKFIFQIVPSILRKPRQLAWLNCLLGPLTTNWSPFVTYRQMAFLEANATSQTIVLENYMNKVLAKGEPEEVSKNIKPTIEIIHNRELSLDLTLEEEGLESMYLPIDGYGEAVYLGLETDESLPGNAAFVIYVYDENIKQGDIEVILRNFNIINSNYQIIYKHNK